MIRPSCLSLVVAAAVAFTQAARAADETEINLPPKLPGGQEVVTFSTPELLQAPDTIKPGIAVAKTVPTVDFLYYPGQDYPGHPWSVWGDSLAVGDIYYSAIGDHQAPQGNAYVYEYDSNAKKLRRVVNVRETIDMPKGHYTPGKIHTRLDLGKDGWLYFGTHRGSTTATVDANHYKGDWILRYNPETEKTEVVKHAPLPKQALPTGILDPDRLIWYAGTADGDRSNKRVMFLAYDVPNGKVLYSDDYGPYRAAIFARSTGNVYFQREGGAGKELPLVRFNPDEPGKPEPIQASLGLRACTAELPNHKVYTADGDNLWEFDTQTETARRIGDAAVGTQNYIATLDADPKTNRYLYYSPGAHGGGERDGSPLVQYDLKTNQRKVICFLRQPCYDQTGFIPMGTYGIAVAPEGDKVYITWNGNYGTPKDQVDKARIRFNICGLTVVHIPESERRP
jgi:hypothetical protein